MSPRRLAFDVLRQVTGDDAYANLALAKRLATAGFDARDAAFATELVAGTCRMMGSYDRIIEAASGRKLSSLQPAVVDLLRLGAHQILSMEVPNRAAVATTVDLARATVGQRVTGLVNAVLRKVGAKDLQAWIDQLADGAKGAEALAIRGHHPTWIAESYLDLLPPDEVALALAANNVSPRPTLVVRPGLATVEELVKRRSSSFGFAVPDGRLKPLTDPTMSRDTPLGGEPTAYSPFGAVSDVVPAEVPAVAEGRAGVQDEGSQLVAWALTRVDAPDGPWLDMCAGPGGKAALLAGLAAEQDTWLLAGEAQEHRARLVAQALAGYPEASVITADGTRPAWSSGSFSRVMVDAPCSGLGALRRRPESRWRRSPADVRQLAGLQEQLLNSALDAAMPGGVVAYVTCSPHRSETTEIVEVVVDSRDDVQVLRAADLLPEVPDAALGDHVQLWPHRHGTDAMFLALLRRT